MRDGKILLFLSALLAGCSVINTFGDVELDGGSGASGDGGDASVSGGAGGTETGGSSGSITGGAGGTGGSATGGVSGSDGGNTVHPTPTQGLIVVGGTDGTHGVLSVLQGASTAAGAVPGTELKRETLATGVQIAGVAYEGAAGRDDWFVFLATSFPAAADQAADLEIRYFDDVAKSWTLISKKTALPSPRPEAFAVLNGRLAYLSSKVVASMVVPSLTLLDTTDLTNVKEITIDPLMLPADAKLIGLLGARGAIGDPNGLGGQLTVIFTTNCATTCDLNVLPITVGDNVVPSVPKLIDTFVGRAAFASAIIQQKNYYALPQGAANIRLLSNDPRNPDMPSSFTTPYSAGGLGSLALAECPGAGLFTSNVHKLFGVKLVGTVGTDAPLDWAGQLVRWDPFSSTKAGTTISGTVVASFNPDLVMGPAPDAGTLDGGAPMPAMSAFTVSSNGTANLSLAQVDQSSWDPPADLHTNVMEVRFPVGVTCPQ